MKKRILSMLMAMVMVITMMPTVVLAENSSQEEHKHCVCGSTTCSGEGHNPNQVWAAWDGTGTANVLKTNEYVYLSQTTANSSNNYLNLRANNTYGTNEVEYLCLHGNTWNSNETPYAIQIADGNSLTVTDCSKDGTGKIEYHYNSNYGCVYINKGHFTLINGTIEHNSKCAIYTYSGNSAENQSVTIKGGTLSAPTGIHAESGKVTIDGGTILATKYGTDMYDVATLYFNDGTIDMRNWTDPNSGHGIAGGKVYMKGGTVKGGNIGIRSNANLEIEGGTIEKNKIGVMNYTGACYVRGGTFKNNTEDAIQYRNPYSYGYLYMSGNPKFESNTVDINMFHSAKVPFYLENGKTLAIDEDAKIKVAFGSSMPSAGNSTAFTGGGFGDYLDNFVSTQGYPISVDNSGALVVTNNSYPITVASGIANGSVSVSTPSAAAGETVTITATPAEGYEVNTVSYTPAGGSETPVTAVEGVYSFTMPAKAVTVSVTFKAIPYSITPSPTENGSFTVKVGDGEATTATKGETITITATPAPGYEVNTITVYKTGEESSTVDVNEDNEFTMPAYPVTVSVTFKAIVSHSHCICGATHASVGDHDEPVSTTFTRVTTQEDLQTAATSGGSAYLANDIELTSTITVASGQALNLCLNGKKLYYTGSGNVSIFTVAENATLNITDCGTTERPGYVDGATYLWTPGIADSEDDIPYDLTGGLVTGGTGCKTNPSSSYSYGGAVYVNPGSNFNLYGGNIAGNDTTYAGGGVCGENASMAVYGGCMVGNDTGAISIWDLDGYDENFPTLSIYGGELEYNRAPSNIDGEIDVDGPITMTGGTVTAEHSWIAMKSIGNAFTMMGGTVTCKKHFGTAVQFNGNPVYTETQEGNTVYRTDTPAKVTLSDGTINAPSSGYGLALFNGYSDLYLSGTPVLTDNDSDAAIAIYRAEENNTWEDAGNTYVYCCSTGHIVLDGQLSWQDPVLIKVFAEDSNENADPATLDFTSGWNTYMRDADPADYFTSGHYSAEVAKNAQTGELKMAESYYVILSDAETEYGSYNVDKYSAYEGDTVTITATPIAGYEVGRVKVSEFLPGPMSFSITEEQGEESTEISVTKNGNGTYSFVMPAYAVEVQVTFKVKTVVAPSGSSSNPSYPVVADKSEAFDGTIDISASNAKKGSTVTVTVTPDKYYGVEKVIVRDESGKEIQVTENADGTYSFKMPSGKVTVEAVYVWENPFEDVKEGTYYIDPVEWALKNDITAGTSKTTFSPNSSCTRAQMVTFLWNSAGRPEPSGDDCAFNDVSKDSYYEKAVRWAYENGITKGTSETTFSPDMECSRAHMATFLCQMADGKAESDTNAFVDVKSNAYYADSVQWAVENGITKGTGNNKYSPDATCTRGQMVTFLYQYYNK